MPPLSPDPASCASGISGNGSGKQITLQVLSDFEPESAYSVELHRAPVDLRPTLVELETRRTSVRSAFEPRVPGATLEEACKGSVEIPEGLLKWDKG